MGAVVGGLYVTAPNSDLTARYRALIAAYQKRTEESTPLYRKVAIWLRLTELSFENKHPRPQWEICSPMQRSRIYR